MRAAVGLRGEVEATGDIKLIGNDFAIDPAADITADNVIFCRRSGGRLDIHSGGHINFTELNTIDADYIFGDHGANTATEIWFYNTFSTDKDITASAGVVYFNLSSDYEANNIRFIGDDLYLNGTSLAATNNVIFSRRAAGDLIVGSGSFLGKAK